ncbi:DNA-protecting protein DprA [bacterium]|nr:MAG: DNA-protecting protein DprA [bacterium]QQR62000.1 MAG: DNA-protecting protein DprA [bacterium]QQR62406.1 MAG: DNA-protecting protein DprA [bacterium]
MHKRVILQLSLVEGVGSKKIQMIQSYLERNDLCWTDIAKFDVATFEHQIGFSSTDALNLRTVLSNEYEVEKEITEAGKNNIHWTTFLDSDYPDQLKHSHNPPAVLYWQGNQDLKVPFESLAVVGSRAMDGYGKQVLESLLPECVVAGIPIISGGALGIDAAAHQISLEYGGKTVVVLGSGLLKPYPEKNRALFEQVADSGGFVISGFPLHIPPVAQNFPIRNRVIAGLSHTCLVVQAAEKSGALITAECALQEGRNVAAVPGDVFDPLSAGCNNLIKNGAYVVQNSCDILELFNIKTVARPQLEITTSSHQKNSKKLELVLQLTVAERMVFQSLKKGDNYTFEELLSMTQLSLSDLNAILIELEMKGLIETTLFGYRLV